jgi:hypothetical protein
LVVVVVVVVVVPRCCLSAPPISPCKQWLAGWVVVLRWGGNCDIVKVKKEPKNENVSY